MTTRQVIKQLESMGHKVSFYTRKDGGVRITKIDSTKFTGSTGNKRARAMTGEQLSLRRTAQLSSSYMRTPKGTWGHKKNTKPALPEEAKKLIRKAQRTFRQEGTISGTSSTYRFRKNVELFGYEEAMRRLRQNIRYAKGLAYVENVEHLVNVLEDMRNKTSFSSEVERERFNAMIEKIKASKVEFKDVWIQKIRQLLYSRKDNQISTQNLIDDIEEIIES